MEPTIKLMVSEFLDAKFEQDAKGLGSLEKERLQVEFERVKERMAEELWTSIKNVCLHAVGKDGVIRYAGGALRDSLAIFMRCPSAYEEMRANAIVPMPSVSTLKRIKKSFRAEEGFNLIPYELIRMRYDLATGTTNQEFWVKGDFDECQLRGVVAFGNNGAVGFVEPDIDVPVLFQRMWDAQTREEAGEDEQAGGMGEESGTLAMGSSDREADVEAMQPVKHVQLFKFRDLRSGFSAHGNFYYNAGNQTSEDIYRQVQYAILALEIVGIHLVGLGFDCAPTNIGFMRMAVHVWKADSANAWLPKSAVTMPHPLGLGYSDISLIPCNSHNFKSAINQFDLTKPNSSGKGASKSFNVGRKAGDVPDICHKDLCDVLERDNERRSRNAIPYTFLKRDMLNRDGFLRMRMGLAMGTCDTHVPTEMTGTSANLLGYKFPLKEDVSGCIPLAGSPGAFVGLNIKQIDVLLELPWPDGSRNNLQTAKFLAVMGALFNQVMLNSRAFLNAGNIDEIETFVKNLLVNYFGAWHANVLQRRADGETGWMELFMSPVTYRNVRMGIASFFYFARQSIRIYDDPSFFVRMMLGNGSSLENSYSVLKHFRLDTAQDFPAFAAQHALLATTKTAGKKSSYAATTDEEGALNGHFMTSSTLNKHRKDRITFVNSNVAMSSQVPFPTIPNPYRALESCALLQLFVDDFGEGSLLLSLLSTPVFLAFHRLSYSQSLGVWMSRLHSISRVDESNAMETLLWSLMHKCFELHVQFFSQRTKPESFDTLWFRCRDGVFPQDQFNELAPPTLVGDTLIHAVVFDSIYAIFKDWIVQEVKSREPPVELQGAAISDEETHHQVHKLVGFGIFQRLKELKRRVAGANDSNDIKTEIRALQSLRIRRNELPYQVLDTDAETFYPAFIQLIDNGGLSIVVEDLVPWARHFLLLIWTHFSFGNQGLSCVEATYHILESDAELPKLFERGWNACVVGADSEMMERVCSKIMRHAFHAAINVLFSDARERHTSRHANKKATLSLRAKLKVACGRGWDANTVKPAAGYDSKSKPLLKDMCRLRGLLVGGNKGDLVARLERYDGEEEDGEECDEEENHVVQEERVVEIVEEEEEEGGEEETPMAKPAAGYASLKKPQLQEICRKRMLKRTGKKEKVVARLDAYDAEKDGNEHSEDKENEGGPARKKVRTQ
ncbi:hypothetical protein HDU98_010785 [Podochytrium sp. JEL0797]|nr:hypothetical protein HDU98_010785 [Podochytrium sp. JEL0797]